MLTLVQSTFYLGVNVVLVLLLLLPLIGMLAFTAVYFCCDFIQFVLGRRFFP